MDDNVIAVWFPPGAPGSAHDGLEALARLHDRGAIRVLHAGVAERQADGTLAVSEKARESWRLGPAIGGVVGGLLGVVGGPIGIALGAGAGALVGEGAESEGRRHARRMLQVVHQHPEPGAVLLLAELSEPAPSPLDAELDRLGGQVVRRSVFDVERELAEAKAG